MAKPIDDKEARKYLAAFADGELEVQQNLQMLEHMAMNPQATRRVMHQQQLRRAVGQAMKTDAPPAPQALVDRVTRLAQEPQPATVSRSGPRPGPAGRAPTLGWVGRWQPAAVAAVLLVAAIFVATTGRHADGTHLLLPAATIHAFQHRHVECSRTPQMPDGKEAFFQDLERLPPSIESHLGRPATPSLDLTPLGYQFQAAGKCNVPGEPAVHMIYSAMAHTGRNDSLSLWIRVYEGQPSIEAGRIYAGTPGDSTHPVLLWRQGEMIYYLTGDASAPVSDAASALAGS